MKCNSCSLCTANNFLNVEASGDKTKGAKIVMYQPGITDYKSKIANSNPKNHLSRLLSDYGLTRHTHITYAIKCIGELDEVIVDICTNTYLLDELKNAKVVLLLGANVSRLFFKNIIVTNEPKIKTINGVDYVITNYKGMDDAIKIFKELYRQYNPLI